MRVRQPVVTAVTTILTDQWAVSTLRLSITLATPTEIACHGTPPTANHYSDTLQAGVKPPFCYTTAFRWQTAALKIDVSRAASAGNWRKTMMQRCVSARGATARLDMDSAPRTQSQSNSWAFDTDVQRSCASVIGDAPRHRHLTSTNVSSFQSRPSALTVWPSVCKVIAWLTETSSVWQSPVTLRCPFVVIEKQAPMQSRLRDGTVTPWQQWSFRKTIGWQ